MWKAPYRPANEITQNYTDGIVKIYAVENTAKPGYKPVETPVYKISLRFEEQRLGVQRYYAAKQNQIQIDRVIRTPRAGDVNNQDVAVANGKQYRIDMVQSVPEVYPPSMDLTLTKIETEFEGI